jgi:hypothetical protein
MKNFRAKVRSGKVHCRFSAPIFQREIASRKFQAPIFHVQQALEIFQGRFSSAKRVSPKVLRPSLLYQLPLKFFRSLLPMKNGS